MSENAEKSIENIVKELRRLQDIELHVAEALRKHGLTLVKTAAGYDVMKLGEITAQSQKKSPGQSDQLPKNIRVHGWVWKDKHTEDDCYIPSYTPAQHVPRGELLALVDPADLHEPLQNTKWF